MAISFDLGSPINTALLLYILYAVQRIIFPSTSAPSKTPTEFKSGYSWMPYSHPPTVLFKTYTPKTLEPFSGKDGGRILLGINGTVFDVTAGRNFYGPGPCPLSPCTYGPLMVCCRRNVRKFRWPRRIPRDGEAVLRCGCVHITQARGSRSELTSSTEMLTPIDQPLDSLADLRPDEM